MKSKFEFQNHFRKKHEQLIFSERKGYDNYLNLKSNELHHSEIDSLFNEFLKEYNPLLNRKYPIYASYKKELANFYNVKYDQILIAPGTNFLIQQVLELITFSTNSLVLQSPNYMTYHQYPRINNTRIIEIDYWKKSEEMFLEELLKTLKKISSSTVIITNPNGFTGEQLKFDNVKKIAECCLNNNHVLIIDEAYVEFSERDHLELILPYPNVLIIRTLSKSFGFAGLRIGFAFGNEELIKYLRKFGIENTLSNVILDYLIFLHRNLSTIKRIQQDIITSREKLINFIHNKYPEWHVYKSKANFICVDVRTARAHANLLETFENKKIIIKDLEKDSSIKNHIRITVGDKYILRQLLKVLKNLE